MQPDVLDWRLSWRCSDDAIGYIIDTLHAAVATLR